jgi:ABC-type transport system involved in multi-copper enzyme maturation permease subunit
MAATTITRTSTRTSTRSGYVRAGLVATVAAAVATTALAAAGHAAGVSLDVMGAPIPLAGFAQLTAFFALVGLGLAAILSRYARHPRTAFVRTTVVLTGLSLVPDLIVGGTAPATRVLLITTHLVAAAIVIPAITRRLGR